MLIENAFHYLPEILCGSNYAIQEYEAGIVNAISLAVLQELNARNVPNPLASLTVEKLYSKDGFDKPDASPGKRNLRADLFVDVTRNMVATEALSRFGWRHKNFLEAKYFRPDVAPSTNCAALLLGDFIRLCCLTPPVVNGWDNQAHPKPSPCEGAPSPNGKYKEICVGRYLLHVYQGNPGDLVGKTSRPWLKELRSPSGHMLKVCIGDDKATTFKESLSTDLEALTVEAGFTNRVIAQREAAEKTNYLCALTRIDWFKVSLNGLSWEENAEREGAESAPGDWKKLQALVGKYLMYSAKNKKKGEDVPPSEVEIESYVSGSLSPVGGN